METALVARVGFRPQFPSAEWATRGRCTPELAQASQAQPRAPARLCDGQKELARLASESAVDLDP